MVVVMGRLMMMVATGGTGRHRRQQRAGQGSEKDKRAAHEQDRREPERFQNTVTPGRRGVLKLVLSGFLPPGSYFGAICADPG